MQIDFSMTCPSDDVEHSLSKCRDEEHLILAADGFARDLANALGTQGARAFVTEVLTTLHSLEARAALERFVSLPVVVGAAAQVEGGR